MISVIIPMYNSKDTIERSLDSIKNQTQLKLIKEIIVVNDGSTDESLEIVESYIKSNPEMPIQIIGKNNGGVSSARNTGLKIAKEEYIALLDSDDEWMPAKIRVQLEILTKDVDLYLLGTTLNNQKFGRYLFKKFQHLTRIMVIDLAFKNYFQPSTVVFRRLLLEKIGLFPEDQRYAEEGNFFMRAAHHVKCALLNESYLIFGNGKHGFGVTGLSANLVEMQKGEIRNLKFALREKYINRITFGIAFLFSYMKYIRRKAKVWLRR